MRDLTLSLAELVATIGDGASLAFGGGGIQRKPIAAARAIAASERGGFELMAMLGGPEVDLLLGLGKVAKLSFAFVGFDAYGLAPNFRRARESASLAFVEYSEATMLAGFEAAAKNLPFLPTRFALGTDLTRTPTTPFRNVICPFTGDNLLAVPALRPDVAIIHVNEADRDGNAVILGDAYADTMLVRAARRVFLTAERVVDRLPRDHTHRASFISRLWVSGVIEAPRGAGFTAQFPEYPFDLPTILAYQRKATDRAWLEKFARSGDAS
jgi:glutaconate CoA-transferase subunit A